MRDENADSVVVTEDDEVLGILTDIDLRNKIVADGVPPETLVNDLMHRNALRLDADEPVFQALMDMMQQQTYHVVVSERKSPKPKLLGVISDKDISRAQGNSPAFMTERVEQTNSPEDLYGIRGEIDKLLIRLERQGVKPKDLVTINTELNDHLMKTPHRPGRRGSPGSAPRTVRRPAVGLAFPGQRGPGRDEPPDRPRQRPRLRGPL